HKIPVLQAGDAVGGLLGKPDGAIGGDRPPNEPHDGGIEGDARDRAVGAYSRDSAAGDVSEPRAAGGGHGDAERIVVAAGREPLAHAVAPRARGPTARS